MIFKLRKRSYSLLPLLINFLFILILNHLLKNGFLVLSDSPIIFSKIETNKYFLNIWNSNNFGYSNLGEIMAFYPRLFYHMFLNIGMTAKQTELTTYFVFLSAIFYSSWIFFNKLLIKLGFKNTTFSSFWGSFFYTYNLMMIVIWTGGVGETIFELLISLPIILYLFSDIVISDFNIKNITWLGILIGLNYNYIPMTLALLVVFFTSLLIVKGGSLFKNLINTFLIGVLSGMVGLGFLIPQFFFYRGLDIFTKINPADATVPSDLGVSGIFRFFFDWTIKMAWNGPYHFSLFPYYDNSIIIGSVFCIWILCLIYLVKGLKNKEKNAHRVLIYIFTTVVLGIFFDKGFQPPLQGVFKFLFVKMPFFGVFRTPYSKFNYPIVVSLSFLCAYALAKSKNMIVKIFFIFCILLQTIPFFSSYSLIGIKAGKQFQNIVHIPKQYEEIANIANNDPIAGSIIIYPGPQWSTFDYKNGFGLIGQDILEQLIKRPIIYSENVVIYTKSKEKYTQIIKNINSYDLSKNNIRYAFIRTDIVDNSFAYDNKIISDRIALNPNIREVYSSNLGSLYKVNPNNSENLISTNIGDQAIGMKITKNLLEYSIIIPEKIFLQNRSIYFQFNNTYDLQWVLGSKDSRVTIKDHQLFDGFGNQWKIIYIPKTNIGGNIEFSLYYKLQDYYIYGLIFSLIVTLLLIIYVVFI